MQNKHSFESNTPIERDMWTVFKHTLLITENQKPVFHTQKKHFSVKPFKGYFFLNINEFYFIFACAVLRAIFFCCLFVGFV